MSVSDNYQIFAHLEEAYRGRRTVEAQFVREIIALATDAVDSKQREAEAECAGRVAGLRELADTLSESNDRMRTENATLRAQLQRPPLMRSIEEAAEAGKIKLTIKPEAGEQNRWNQHHTWNVEELEDLAYRIRATGADPKKDLVEFDRAGAHCIVPEEGTFQIVARAKPPRMPAGDDPRSGKLIEPKKHELSPPVKITLIGGLVIAGVLQWGQWLVGLVT